MHDLMRTLLLGLVVNQLSKSAHLDRILFGPNPQLQASQCIIKGFLRPFCHQQP